ncbi:hypothetical protein T492DRAFT_86033 [Pavlovales sp. CCMP2436]|nr:hypothetical protein T492DRAFT_86033 [Pavlovales sp. CCMP2436]
MGAAQSAAINKADPEEVGLRLTAALTARWFSTSDQSQSASRAELTADQTLVGARNAILDVSSQTLQEFMAYSGTPARRELTDAIWEFDAFKAYATAAVRHDPKISKLSYRAVPKHCIESEFWRLYFVSVYAALAEVQAEDSLMPTSKSRRLSTMSSPKRLTPLSLPRGNSCFLRKEPWARVGGESLWLLR